MERIDFYVLETPEPDARYRFACRLTEKAWRAGHQIYLHADSEAEAGLLDDLLWTFRAESFVPHAHGNVADCERLRVLIGSGNEYTGAKDLLINLAVEVPQNFGDFQRIAEIVGGGDTARQAGRQRYRFYRDHGCSLQSHSL